MFHTSLLCFMGEAGLEPTRLAALRLKLSVSTISPLAQRPGEGIGHE